MRQVIGLVAGLGLVCIVFTWGLETPGVGSGDSDSVPAWDALDHTPSPLPVRRVSVRGVLLADPLAMPVM